MGGARSRRQAAGPNSAGEVLSLSPAEAGWEYLSFTVWRLTPGQSVAANTGGEEIALVVLSGTLSVRSSAGEWPRVGERTDPFSGPPAAVYLAPGTSYTLQAISACEVARAGAPAGRGAEARLIAPHEVADEPRGEGNSFRIVRRILLADRPAERLLVSETVTPNGGWSSYPPHKHDVDDPPRESRLEETYYHRLRPPQGFALQRIYTPDRDLDEAVVVEDGTLVLVPRGYHPVVVAPGFDLYYLNAMAGPTRAWYVREDPLLTGTP